MRWQKIGIFIFFVFMNCFTFPAYNFVKTSTGFLMIINLVLVWTACISTGESEVRLFPKRSVWTIALRNLIAIGAGLICRYLLEFGEVSNTYNYVPVNLAVHISAMLVLSTFIYWRKRKGRKA